MRCQPPANQPRIAVMVSDGVEEYFIICEQTVLCKVSSLKEPIFIGLATYYCFSLEYPKECKRVLTFLQDYVVESPDSNKRSATYVSVSTDINNNI